MDPYQVLGVAKTATQDEIKNAYRERAKKFHPDLNPGSKEAEAKFKELSGAYEKVGTAEERAKFDRGETEEAAAAAAAAAQASRHRYTRQAQGGDRYAQSFGEGFDEDIFASIFGNMGGNRGGNTGGGRGGTRARGPVQGTDALYQMEIDLKDAVLGAEKEITLPGGKKLSVRIPAGVTEGMRLRFAGQGAPGVAGGPTGDAYVEIGIRPDPRFKRQGDDLVFELPISIADAVFGGEARVPTLEGAAMVKIPAGSNTDRRLRLPGKGATSRGAGKRGDEIVILKVMMPDQIDDELREALKKWQERQAKGAVA